MTSGDFQAAGENKQEQTKTCKKRCLLILVWSSVTVHTAGRNEEHADEDKLKLTVFNMDKARQGKARQGRADTQEHRGVTSRPDETY